LIWEECLPYCEETVNICVVEPTVTNVSQRDIPLAEIDFWDIASMPKVDTYKMGSKAE
jgi:hypothetical protein